MSDNGLLTDRPSAFSTANFLGFLFSVVFLLICCGGFILYTHTFLGVVVTLMMRLVVLPKGTRFRVGGIHISLLQARIFFQNVFFQNENFSLRILDGYFTFAFWGYWLSDNNWTTVQDFMVSDNLVDMRCKVSHGLGYVKGTIVGVDHDNKKLLVRLDPIAANAEGATDDEDAEEISEDGFSDRKSDLGAAGPQTSGAPGGPATPVGRDYGDDLDDPLARRAFGDLLGSNRRAAFGRSAVGLGGLPPTSSFAGAGASGAVPASAAGATRSTGRPSEAVGLDDELVKPYDYGSTQIRSRPGRVQLHLNGMRFSLYNATGKYRELAEMQRGAAGGDVGRRDKAGDKDDGRTTRRSKFRQRIIDYFRSKAGVELDDGSVAGGAGGSVDRGPSNSKQAKPSASGKHRSKEKKGSQERRRGKTSAVDPEDAERQRLEAARRLQEHQRTNKGALRRFFAFIGGVELEFYDSFVDVGGAGAEHPYFLHTSFHRGEGRLYFCDSPHYDIHRLVTEVSLHKVDMRMAQMDSKLTENQVMRNPTLRDRAQLLFGSVGGGTTGAEETFSHTESSDLIKEFGVLMNGTEMNTVHVVFYRDTPNVFAGEPTERATLPKTGVEIMLDTPRFCYGPWLEYCRSQLWSIFLPPNYRTLEPLKFVVGEPRPMAGMEFFVEFMQDTTLDVPFKHRERTPAPPFGIADSKRKGLLQVQLGKGTQFIQPSVFLLPGEEHQKYEALFMANDVRVYANCVLGRQTVFLEAESMQLFLDRRDGLKWNERKLWNILPLLANAKMYWYMLYTDYFMDLLQDWQFAYYMYHHNTEPLTTEVFNTSARAIRDFVPNVKRFEVFCIKSVTLFLNVNSRNVVYADDPNDLEENAFAIVKAKSLNFSMVMPADLYMLSAVNEVVRPLDVRAQELQAFLSLPKSHPLYSVIDTDEPWATCNSLAVYGDFTVNAPNQSVPQDRFPTVPETGRTKLTNFLDLHVDFDGLRGRVMGCHIKALIAVIQNLFLDNSFTIAPDELYWLLAKLQSHATDDKNRRKDLKNFIEFANPASNDLETAIFVTLRNMDVDLAMQQKGPGPLLNLKAGQLDFTYIKQFACNDMTITVTPITMRVVGANTAGNKAAGVGKPPSPSGRKSAESYVCVGDVAVGMSKHFGRMPLKPKIHELIDAKVDGVSFHLELPDILAIAEVAQTVGEHFRAEDAMMEEEVEAARTAAELMAEQVFLDSHMRAPDRSTSSKMRNTMSSNPNNTNNNNINNSINHPTNGGYTVNSSLYGPGTNAYSSLTTAQQAQLPPYPSSRRPTQQPHPHYPPSLHNNHESLPSDGPSTTGAEPVADGSNPGQRMLDVDALARGQLTGPSQGARWHSNASPPPQALGSDRATSGDGGVELQEQLTAVEFSPMVADGGEGPKRKRRGIAFFGGWNSSSSSSDTDSADRRHDRGFARTISTEQARAFASYMEDCTRASDEAKDYGLFFNHIEVNFINGVVRVDEEGLFALNLSQGVQVATSTLNDGNSNNRISVSARHVLLQAFIQRDSERLCSPFALARTAALNYSSYGEYVEVFHAQTSLCVRHYTAFPFDGSLEAHAARQRRFIEENNYEGLVVFDSADVEAELHRAAASPGNVRFSPVYPADGSPTNGAVPASTPFTTTAAPVPSFRDEFLRAAHSRANEAGVARRDDAENAVTPRACADNAADERSASLSWHSSADLSLDGAAPRPPPPVETGAFPDTVVPRPSPAGGGSAVLSSGSGGDDDRARPRGAAAAVTRAGSPDVSQTVDPDTEDIAAGDSNEGGEMPTVHTRRRLVPVSSTPSPLQEGEHTGGTPHTLPRNAARPSGDRQRRADHADPQAVSGGAAAVPATTFAAGELVSTPTRPAYRRHTAERAVGAIPVRGTLEDPAAAPAEGGPFGTAPPPTPPEHAALERGNRNRTSPSSNSSVETTAHTGRHDSLECSLSGRFDGSLSLARSLSGVGTQSGNFRTCVSMTEDLSGAIDPFDDDDDDATSSTDGLDDSSRSSSARRQTLQGKPEGGENGGAAEAPNAFNRAERFRRGSGPQSFRYSSDNTRQDSYTPRPRGQTLAGGSEQQGRPRTSSTSIPAPPQVPTFLFYRSFNCSRLADTNTTSLRYDPWPRARRHRGPPPGTAADMTGFGAEIPVVSFNPASVSSYSPDFYVSRWVQKLDGDSVDDGWMRQQADNRERSKTRSTTKHLHVHGMAPVTALITKEFVLLACTALENVTAGTNQQRRGTVQEALTSTFTNFSAKSARRRDPLFFQSKNPKSRVRIQQKRWQWEDLIYSVLVPCVEVKLLTHSPVPADSRPSGTHLLPSPPDGIYSSTLVVRDLNFVLSQKRPPSGVEAVYNMKLIVSVKVSTVALLTHIEFEPLKRNTRLSDTLQIPFVPLDPSKDLIAAVYVTNVVVKAKRDMQRGLDGGACNVSINAINAHLTRDFLEYTLSIRSLASTLEGVLQKNKRTLATLKASSQARQQKARGTATNLSTQFAVQTGERRVRGMTVQGNGGINSFRLEIVDTVQERGVIVLDTRNASSLSVTTLVTSFIVVTPHRAGDNAINVRGMGEVTLLKARLFPSLLHAARSHRTGTLAGGDSSYFSGSAASGTFGAGNGEYSGWAARAGAAFQSHDTSPLNTNGGSPFGPPSSPMKAALSSMYTQQEKKKRFKFVYNVSFSLKQLDVALLYSVSNYVRLTGADLAGCAESRPAAVTSRECVQMDVLTEGISENIQRKLKAKARQARERVRSSRYAAPPDTTAQLLYKSGVSFYSKLISLSYVADAVLPSDWPGAGGGGGSGDTAASNLPGQSSKSSEIHAFASSIENTYITAHITRQHDIESGKQVNLMCVLQKLRLLAPHRPSAAETVLPQMRQFIEKWKASVAAVSRRMQRADGGGGGGGCAADDGARSSLGTMAPSLSPRIPQPININEAADASRRSSTSFSDALSNHAVTLNATANNIEVVMGLPKGIVQRFSMPELSVFARTSSNDHASIKIHLHPFTVSSRSPPHPYSVSLPHIYILYGHDDIKMTLNVMFEVVAVTMSSVFMNHLALAYDRMMREILPMFRPIPVRQSDPSAADSPASPSSAQAQPPHSVPSQRQHRQQHASSFAGRGGYTGATTHPQRPPRRRNFLFLLEGLRFSYVTSMTNLRFTIARVSATADTASEEADTSTLRWVVHVVKAKVALVDRDDHDRLMATVESLSHTNRAMLTGASRSSTTNGRTVDQRHGGSPPTLSGFGEVFPNNSTSNSNRGVNMDAFGGTRPPGAAASGGGDGAESAYSSRTRRFTQSKESEVLTSNPLGGFTWGSAQCSFTLSSGMVSHNTIEAALRGASSSFSECSPELQRALLSNLNNSTLQWNLTVTDPLFILRVGLPNMIKECARETQQDVMRLKAAAHEEDKEALFRLNKSQTFKKLQREKKRYDTLLRKTEEDRMEKLRKVTEQVAKDTTRRRGGFMQQTESYQELYSLLMATRKHTVVASIDRLLLVVPFGDAAFRSIMEEVPGAFGCGKQERHIHSESCLNRRHFIPALALKCLVQSTSFNCTFESTKQYVQTERPNESIYPQPSFPGSNLSGQQQQLQPLGHYVFSHRFVGRFGMQSSNLFVTEGTAVPAGERKLLLKRRRLLGGRGTLSDYSLEEIQWSRNTIAIEGIEAPIYFSRKDGASKVGAVVDLSSPRVQVSSHIISILNLFMLEWTPLKIRRVDADKDKTPPTTVAAAATTAEGSGARADNNKKLRRGTQKKAGHDAASAATSAADTKPSGDAPKPPTTLCIDVSARLAVGELTLYANQVERTPPPTSETPRQRDSRFSRKRLPLVKRAVSDSTFSYSHNDSRRGPSDFLSAGGTRSTSGGSGRPPQQDRNDHREAFMVRVHVFPLPSVIVQAVAHRSSEHAVEDSTIVWAEVKAGTLLFGPTVILMAKDIERSQAAFEANTRLRVRSIMSLVQETERAARTGDTVFHTPVADVLLPLPRSLATVLGKERLRNVVHLGKNASANAFNFGDEGTARSVVVLADHSKKRNAFIGVHLTVTELKVVLTTEPITSTALTVFLDTGGSINLVLRRHLRPLGFSASVASKKANEGGATAPMTAVAVPTLPSVSADFVVNRLRAECQTKLDVKSLEVSLPQLNACFAVRQSDEEVIRSLNLHLPFDAEGSEPNLTVRLQHIDQVFAIVYLWMGIWRQISASARKLLRDGQSKRTLRYVKNNPMTRSFLIRNNAAGQTQRYLFQSGDKNSQHQQQSQQQQRRVKRTTMVTVSVSHGRALFDLGSGNTHQLYLDSCQASGHVTVHADGCRASLLLMSIKSLGMRCEGVLAGNFTIGGAHLHTFLIENVDGAPVFHRSPEGRTFRETLSIEDVSASFKERQLRDVLQCSIAQLRVDAMDGIDPQQYALVNAEVLLHRAVFGAAPTTVPVFLGVVRSVSAQVTQQKAAALDRLRDRLSALDAATAGSAGSRGSVVNTGGGSGGGRARPHGASLAAADFQSIFPTGDASEGPARGTPPTWTGDGASATAIGSPLSRRSSSGGSSGGSGGTAAAPAIPYFGSPLNYVPCGEIRVSVSDSSLMLGAMSAGEAATGSVVIRVPRLRLRYAECPCDDYTAAKKVLLLESKDLEVYRPGTVKTVVMGFKDVNTLSFYTLQRLSENEVGFTLTLTQKMPWTGNPRFRDFEEIIMIIKSFTDKRNADVLKQFGRSLDTSAAPAPVSLPASATPSVGPDGLVEPPPLMTRNESEGPLLSSNLSGDKRVLKALRSSKFSPQLRFGGDVSVNTEVILNWLGITEKMLPNVINAKVNDSLERALVWLAHVASERMVDSGH